MARLKKTAFTLEDYEHFLENPYASKFTLEQLNQVIYMHGFSKIRKQPKMAVLNALSTIDLAKPYRSTLDDDEDYGSAYSHTGDFSMSPDELKRDLEELKWQECYIHCTETVGPAAAEKNGVMNSGNTCDVFVPKDLLASMTSPITRRNRSRKRKRRSFVYGIGESSGGGDDISDNGAIAGGDNYFRAQDGTDATVAAAAVKVEAGTGNDCLYVDTYYWDL